MSDYYLVAVNTETGASGTVGPYSWHTARRADAILERHPNVVAGVVGRISGGAA